VIEVDARGLSCPLPVMRTQEVLKDRPAELTVLADSGTAKANVEGLLADSGYEVSTEQGPDGYRIVGTRG
jgi:tRNA 2-thiouridine synthesizing protein A